MRNFRPASRVSLGLVVQNLKRLLLQISVVVPALGEEPYHLKPFIKLDSRQAKWID